MSDERHISHYVKVAGALGTSYQILPKTYCGMDLVVGMSTSWPWKSALIPTCMGCILVNFQQEAERSKNPNKGRSQ